MVVRIPPCLLTLDKHMRTHLSPHSRGAADRDRGDDGGSVRGIAALPLLRRARGRRRVPRRRAQAFRRVAHSSPSRRIASCRAQGCDSSRALRHTVLCCAVLPHPVALCTALWCMASQRAAWHRCSSSCRFASLCVALRMRPVVPPRGALSADAHSPYMPQARGSVKSFGHSYKRHNHTGPTYIGHN